MELIGFFNAHKPASDSGSYILIAAIFFTTPHSLDAFMKNRAILHQNAVYTGYLRGNLEQLKLYEELYTKYF